MTKAFCSTNVHGYSGLENFAMILNMDVLSSSNYNSISHKLHLAGQISARDSLERVREDVRRAHRDLDPSIMVGDKIPIAVSFDGSWHKQGFTSTYGLGCVVDLLTGRIVPLSTTSPEGYRYILGRLHDTEPTHLHLNDAIKLLFMVIDAAMREDAMTPGVVFIYDMKGIVFQHLTRINAMTIKKYITYLREAMPVRLKALHVINVNSVLSSVMSIIKPLIKQEEMQKLHFHSGDAGMAEFFQAVPQKIMPKDYGGQSDSVEELMGDTQKLLLNYRGWFQEEEQLTVDESKRTSATRSAGTIFGLDGSFKKLDID